MSQNTESASAQYLKITGIFLTVVMGCSERSYGTVRIFLRNQFNLNVSQTSVSYQYSLPKCNDLRFDFRFFLKQRLKVNVWTPKGRPTQSLASNNCWQLHNLIFNHRKWWCGQFVCRKQWKYKYQVFVTEVAWISEPSWATTNWCCGFAERMAMNYKPGSTE